MEKNRSVLFRVLGSVLVLGVAAGVLFGLTGVLRDPVVVAAAQAETQKPEPTAAVAPPTPPSPALQADAGTAETVAKVEAEPFPEFDEEPTGS